MKRTNFTLILLVLTGFSWGQNTKMIGDLIDPNYFNTDLRYKTEIKEIIGSPYLYENWADGYIRILSGGKYEDLQIKFDIYSNNLIMNHQGNEVLINKGMLDLFGVVDPTTKEQRVFKLVRLDDRNESFLCEVLHEGLISAYRLIEAKVIDGINSAGGYGNEKQTARRFKQSMDYYLLKPKGETINIKLNKNSILKSLNSKTKELNSFIKREKMKFKEPAELVKLLEYYDALI